MTLTYNIFVSAPHVTHLALLVGLCDLLGLCRLIATDHNTQHCVTVCILLHTWFNSDCLKLIVLECYTIGKNKFINVS